MIIAPSILSMDFARMREQLEEVRQSKATWLHVDVMDGHFVPNLTFGPDIVKSVRQHSPLFMDVHIMVSDPFRFAPIFIEAGADLITFHFEACQDGAEIQTLIDLIHGQGKKAGLSVKPATPIEAVFPYLQSLDLVLVMSVEPGFGGQAFQPEALKRIQALRQAITRSGRAIWLEVDGGINESTGAQVLEAGADVLVAGSFVFKQDIGSAVESLWQKQRP